ncbi:protein of unknown function [Candidatus Methylacidiphilum fumarolicum]|uniref:Uncharacterized protein n=1 Tax=Candidatus Methylacidiphilum fumarolicum TaxID=591154 RepID=A0ABM9IDP6_9BACT|nr:protein of unknown function [Candidatus Methylacidiphilum fumarolicum]
MAFQYPLPIQVFDDNRMKPSGEVGRELATGVLPDFVNAGVEAGHLGYYLSRILCRRQPCAFGNRSIVR